MVHEATPYLLVIYCLGLLALGLGAYAGKTKLGIEGSLNGGTTFFRVGSGLLKSTKFPFERGLFFGGLAVVLLSGVATAIMVGLS